MDRVSNVLPYVSIRFVHSSWLSATEVTAAALYWVVDIEFSMAELHQGLQSALPLLLPGERDDVKALWKDGSLIYTYQTAAEATENIARILETRVKGNRVTATKPVANGTATKHSTAGDR